MANWWRRTAFPEILAKFGLALACFSQSVKCAFGFHDEVTWMRYRDFGNPSEPMWCHSCDRRWPANDDERARARIEEASA